MFTLLTAASAVGQPSIPVAPVTTINATLQDGADIGDKINNAASQLPSGGEVYVPAASTCYEFKVPIVIKSTVILRGDGTATCLNYTASSGTAMTLTGGTWGIVMRDFTLQTPGAFKSTSVPGTTGILMANTAGISAYNVNVQGFDTGLTFGSDTWLMSWHEGLFRANSVSVNFPPGTRDIGENMAFIHTTFSGGTQTDGVSSGQNCVMLNVTPRSNSSEFSFISTSFDGCQVVIGENWEAATRFVNPHFEDVQGSLDYPLLKISTGLDPTKGSNVVLTNPNFMLDATQTLPEAFIELDNNATLSMSNAVSQGWGGISAPKSWVAIKGAGSARLSMDGTFHIVHDAGPIPMYRTDGINQPLVTVPQTSNVQGIPVVADGDFVLAEGTLTGDYWVTWGNAYDRYQAIKISISGSYYSSTASISILTNFAYQGNTVISGVRVVKNGVGVPQLVASVGNRNQSSGPLTVQWSGAADSFPQLLPGTAVGTTAITNYGIQQTVDGTTSIAGGMKLQPGQRPECNSTNGGMFWYSQGDTGIADSVQVCARDAAGSYAWHPITLGEAAGPSTTPGPGSSHAITDVPLHGTPIMPRTPFY
jgi:hypothetical protein